MQQCELSNTLAHTASLNDTCDSGTLTKLWYGWLLKNDPILVGPTSVRLVNYASDSGIPREKYNGRVYATAGLLYPTHGGRIQQKPPNPNPQPPTPEPLKTPLF